MNRTAAPLRVLRIDAPRARHGDAMEVFRCGACGVVIGVYEPLVMCDENGTRTTARAAEPKLPVSATAYYHRECHTAKSDALGVPIRREASGR